ncbi:MAG: hypothetical protein ABIR80_04830, partial [Opitutaceae bacterium]
LDPKSHAALRAADTIIVMGFGWNLKNVAKLKLEELRDRKRRIIATSQGTDTKRSLLDHFGVETPVGSCSALMDQLIPEWENALK